MKIEELDLEVAKEIITNWAKSKNFITKVCLFGSRIAGVTKEGKPVRSDSDLDVAVEFIPFPGEDFLTTWVGEVCKWRKELLTLLGFSKKEHLDLQHHHMQTTPHVAEYIKQNSIIIYSSDSNKES